MAIDTQEWLVDLPASHEHLPPAAPDTVEPAIDRLATHVGMLFGIPRPGHALGTISWLSSLESLTISEVGRGAPIASKFEQRYAGMHATRPGPYIINRAVFGDIPGRIAGATLDRYGPDTLAACVLAGANRLLEPRAQDMRSLAESATDYSPSDRLHAFGALVFSIMRPQPYLIGNALRARNIQQDAMTGPVIASAPESVALTRCELTPGAKEWGSRYHPRHLEVIDGTAEALGLAKLPWHNSFQGSEAVDLLVAGVSRLLRPRAGGGLTDIEVFQTGNSITAQAVNDPGEFIDTLAAFGARLLASSPNV